MATIRVYVCTNRAGALPPAPGQPPAADTAIRFGVAEVERLGDPLRTESTRSIRSFAERGRVGLTDLPPGAVARDLLQDWFAEAAARSAVPLLFIHGFANGFEDALRRAAQIAEFYEGGFARLLPLVFAWPSSGRTIGSLASLEAAEQPYHDDQSMAARSGPALARLLREVLMARAIAGAAGDALALLAHSMGNHALLHGLQQLPDELLAEGNRGAFRRAAEMAADVDISAWDVGQPLRKLAFLAQQVSIGLNVDPVLSTVSRIANHGGRRLGFFGPRDLSTLPDNVAVVDCWPAIDGTDTLRIQQAGGTDWDAVYHQCYRNNQNVRADLAAFLTGADLSATREALPAALRVDSNRSRTHKVLSSVFQVAGPPPTGG